MNLFKRYFLLFLATLLCSIKAGNAQFYSTGQDPSAVRWMQIKSPNFQVIYQKGFDDQALITANILESYYQKAGESLAHSPKKISVVIHNQTIVSNGYVAWAPKRMELYATPPQDIYPDPWLEHLCIHELRHVVQIDKLNQGITKILAVVFGQQATGLVAGQLPMWYYEGDAVSTETAFTSFGRGRIPSFHQGIKTHLLSNTEWFSFDKALNGSYKDYVPNHYEYGYQLTAYARYKYGHDIWNKVENYVAKNSYTLLPTYFSFYRGLKKYTGLSQKELYHETMDFLDSTWSSENQGQAKSSSKMVQSYDINEFENYTTPLYVEQNQYIALKKGNSHIPQFVLVSDELEKVIYEPGRLISEEISFSNNILVWAEYMPDIRWQNREFAQIKLLNIRTGVTSTLVEKSRYFSPAISNDATKIAVVEVDEKNISYLVILDTFTGEVIEKIQSADGSFIQKPRWGANNAEIYVIDLRPEGKQVSRYDLQKKIWQKTFSFFHSDIQKIIPADDKIYFHSTYNGTDNIYVYDQKANEVFQLTSFPFGAINFDINTKKNELLVSEYTSQGYRLGKVPLERALWKNADTLGVYRFFLAEELAKNEKNDYVEEVIVNQNYTPTKYRKMLHPFNFHSWVPAYIDFKQMDLNNVINDPSEFYGNIYPGLMLISQNKLSTVETILGYGYKNGNHYLSSSLILKGRWPVFKLTADYGVDQAILATRDVTWIPPVNAGYSYQVDMYLPLNLSSGKFIRGFRPFLSVEYQDNLYYNYVNDYYIKGLEIVQAGLFYYALQQKSRKDIFPKLGVIFEANLYNTPFESELFKYLFTVDAIFYLPAKRNNGFKVELGYQYQNPLLYLFNSSFSFPRGVENRRTEKLFKLYADYAFPIAYPDWNLGSLIYVKRLRGNIFADYARNSFRVENTSNAALIWNPENHMSFGLELSADYHLLRMMFPFNTGLRIGYIPTYNKPFAEMLFGISISSY